MFDFGIKVVAWGKYTFFHCGCEFNLRGSSFPSILCADHWRHLQTLLRDDLDYPTVLTMNTLERAIDEVQS